MNKPFNNHNNQGDIRGGIRGDNYDFFSTKQKHPEKLGNENKVNLFKKIVLIVL